jgi:hypothetical protein
MSKRAAKRPSAKSAAFKRDMQRIVSLRDRLDSTARELTNVREQLAAERASDFYEDGAGVRHYRFSPGKDAKSLQQAEKQAEGLALALGHWTALAMKDHIWAVRKFVEVMPEGTDRAWLLQSLDGLEARLSTALTVQRAIG